MLSYDRLYQCPSFRLAVVICLVWLRSPPPPYPLAPLPQAQRSVLHVMREENRTSGRLLYQSPFFLSTRVNASRR